MRMKPIRLFWWREASGSRNFGDDLSPLLIERLSGREVNFSNLPRCDMISTGSILDLAIRAKSQRLKRRPFHRTLVWGSGSFGDIKPEYHHLNVSAVRGPLTRQKLGLPATIAVGDPALLLPRIMSRPSKIYRWGIIPHVIHQQDPKINEMAKQTGSIVIDLAGTDPIYTAQQIASCEFIISSSLHGLITADAFGVPSLWMRPATNLFGGEWKFHDYFQSINRKGVSVLPPIHLSAYEDKVEYPNTPLIESLSERLSRALPV